MGDLGNWKSPVNTNDISNSPDFKKTGTRIVDFALGAILTNKSSIFIESLDRDQTTYAIEMLERLKHFLIFSRFQSRLIHRPTITALHQRRLSATTFDFPTNIQVDFSNQRFTLPNLIFFQFLSRK